MKTLYIDTHLYDIDIILFENDQILKRETIKDKKYNSVYLMPSIQKVCPDKNFDEIVVVNGPGSFTGVRLGITIAKTLAYTLNREIKTISYFDMLNCSSDSNDNIFSISDGNGFFIAEYQNHSLVKDLYYLSNKEYQDFCKNNKITTNVAIDFSRVLDYLKNVKPINPHAVKPIYVKLIEVEK